MKTKLVSAIMLTLLLISMLTLAFNVHAGGGNLVLTVLAQWSGGAITIADVYIDGLRVGYTGSNFTVTPGTHEVFVNDFWESGNTRNRYCFSHWKDYESANPRNITVNADTTIEANFVRKHWPGDVNGDGRVNSTDKDIIDLVYAGIIKDPIWVRLCDVNGDGTVTLADVKIVDLNLGNAYPICIGVIGPMAWMQGQGMEEGATLAAEEINATGGILGRPIQLVFADTLRGQTYPDNETGTAAAMELMNASCDFVIGGYSHEEVSGAREVFMDNKTIFLITGAAADSLISVVQTNYARYKYMFRITLNSTVMAKTLASFIKQVAAPKLAALYYHNASKLVPTYIIAENLVWCDSMVAFIQANGSAFGMNLKGVRRPSPLATDFTADIAAAKAAEAKIVVHIFSAVGGANFIKQVGTLKPNFTCIGINVESQQQEFYANVSGACEYETILASSGTRTQLSAGAVAFYDETLSRYGHAPICTSYGAYDAIYTLKEAVERAGKTKSDAVIPELEKTNRISTLGKFKFTGPMGTFHDAFCNEIGSTWTQGYVRPLVCQWQKMPRTGEPVRVVVWPQDHVYSRKWRIPTWIYPLAETDFNLDGNVNATDLFTYLAPAYGARAGGPRWNVYMDCDIDGNGIINMIDVARFARDWGKHASPLSAGMVGASVQTASPIPAITQTDPKTMVYLDKPTINGTDIVNQTVTVNIMISGAVNITSWGADIAFNSTRLNCTGVTTTPIGGFLNSIPGYFWGPNPHINNMLGIITNMSLALFGNTASGNGTLATIHFKVNTGGVSDLHIRNATVSDPSENCTPPPFNIIDTYTVTSSAASTSFTVSNSTDFNLDYGSGFYGHAFSHPAEQLSFNVTGPYPGWSNVTIPKTLLNVSILDQVLVIIDDTPLNTDQRTVTYNGSHYFVYFNYTPGIHNIRILKRPPVYNINKKRYYAKIQEAINEASPKHKILAYAGTHPENVVVNKTVTLIGEYKHNTTIDGIGKTVIRVTATASNITIANFTIQNSGNGYGILVEGSSNNTISNNIITGNNIGVCLNYSSHNTLTNNTMSGNKYNFGLYGTVGTHFDNNINKSNTVDGKPIYYLKREKNTVYNKTNVGTFYLINCNNITIKNLNLTKNVNGIFLWNTTNSKIQNVNASSNLNGIYLQGQSNHNNLTDNTVSNNTIGIYIHSSNNNAIYHNSFIKNTIQANVTESYNTLWNASYSSGGGNYWSDHSLRPPFVVDEFKDVNQNVQGNDGIIDSPKNIDKQNQDNLPLVSPLTPPVYNLNTHRGDTTIQGAINSARSGDTIFVRAGTYRENLTISKSLTLIGIMESTVINKTGTVVTITKDHVTFRGFTIIGGGSTDKGILVSYANYANISENTINKRGYGILLYYSNSCRISGNTINNNTEGIHLEFSGSNIISRNTINNNSRGIVLNYHCSNNDIHRNNVTYNNVVGIKLSSSSNNKIYHNNFNNTNQVDIYDSSNTWDDGYPSGGNYWSDYNKTHPTANEIDNSSIWNQQYNIPNDNPDHYPLMGPWKPHHNVAVVNITPSKPAVWSDVYYHGMVENITVTVENEGDYTEKFNITAYYNKTPITLYTITVTSESSPPIPFTWHTTGLPYGKYTISANATLVPHETNKTDNTRACWVEVRLWGMVVPPRPDHTSVKLEDFGKLKLIYSHASPYKTFDDSPPGPYDLNRPETYYYLPIGNPEYLMPDIDGNGKVQFADVGKEKLIYSNQHPTPPWL